MLIKSMRQNNKANFLTYKQRSNWKYVTLLELRVERPRATAIPILKIGRSSKRCIYKVRWQLTIRGAFSEGDTQSGILI